MEPNENLGSGPDPNEKMTDAVIEGVAGVTLKTEEAPEAPKEESPKTDEEKIKEAVASAPQADNGYVPPTSAAELSYANELAERIMKSGWPKVRVAHRDFARMNYAGLIINGDDAKILKGLSQVLVIDESPDCVTGSYWEAKD